MELRIGMLMETPPTETDYQKMGIDLLKSRGFIVTFLDLTPILNQRYLLESQPSDILNSGDIVRFKTISEFNAFLKNNRDIFILDFVGGRVRTVFIYQTFRKLGVRYAIPSSGSIPMPNRNPDRKPLFNWLGNLRPLKNIPGKLKNKLLMWIYKLPYSINGLQPPESIFVDGYRYLTRLPRPEKTTKIIWSHSYDYDLYLARKDKPVGKKKYCVFIDDYLPLYPNALLIGEAVRNINPGNYYRSLNRFFACFEGKFQMPVVIAAHPRSRYDLHPKCFPGREITRGATINLVASAECVLTMGSTATNFAVLYKKPIIFIISDELCGNHYGRFIINFARQFNKQPINIDRPLTDDLLQELVIQEESYTQYIHNYIKVPGSPEKPFWDIVADHLLAKEYNEI